MLFLITGILSCKKKNTSSNSPSTTNSNPNDIYGSMQVDKSETYSHDTLLTTYYHASAEFWYSPNDNSSSNVIDADSVTLNGIPMGHSTMYHNYFDTSSATTPIIYPYTFRVKGNMYVSSFTYTENGPYPTYTGTVNIPDTINKNSGFNLSLSGISNADNLTIYFTDQNSNHTLYKEFSKPFPSNFNIDSTSISQFIPSNSANIFVKLGKLSVKSFSNRSYNFWTVYTYGRKLVLK